MNPVVVLLLALNGAAQLVTAQPVAFHPLSVWNRPARVTFDVQSPLQPLRTRSLPQPSQSTGNHAGISSTFYLFDFSEISVNYSTGLINSKNGGNVLLSDVQTFLGHVVDKVRNGTKTTTTTEPSTQPATVDIETLPGNENFTYGIFVRSIIGNLQKFNCRLLVERPK